MVLASASPTRASAAAVKAVAKWPRVFGLCVLLSGCPSTADTPTHIAPALPDDLALRLAFTDHTAAAGLGVAPTPGRLEGFSRMLGGLAAADVDDDRDVDLLLIYPGARGTLLFENVGSGQFEDCTADKIEEAALPSAAGALWLDDDGDGDLDLLVTSHSAEGARYFRQHEGVWRRDERTGIAALRYAVSPTAADVNLDGWLDLFVTHWDLSLAHFLDGEHEEEYLYLLLGGAGGFTTPSIPMGLDEDELPFSFAGHFLDLDGDRYPELLLASDFGESRVLKNDQGTVFHPLEQPLSDEHGMGAALIDFDNDGDQDWFVTSIAAPAELAHLPEAENYTGNRLYRNDGAGKFTDVSAEAFVRDGGWGWGACAADFDNDGHLDLFHTNGFEPYDRSADFFRKDPARLFLNLGDGRFVDVAPHVGLSDDNQGRGTVCFDHDDDGDVDIFVMNYRAPPRLWRNDAPARYHFLHVSLRGPAPNTRAVGAILELESGGVTQSRVITAGNTYLGQPPYRVHFGLGQHDRIEELRVHWPDGTVTTERDIAADQHLVLQR